MTDSKERVLQVWPDAICVDCHEVSGRWNIYSDKTSLCKHLGSGKSEESAWDDAASRLASPEPDQPIDIQKIFPPQVAATTPPPERFTSGLVEKGNKPISPLTDNQLWGQDQVSDGVPLPRSEGAGVAGTTSIPPCSEMTGTYTNSEPVATPVSRCEYCGRVGGYHEQQCCAPIEAGATPEPNLAHHDVEQKMLDEAIRLGTAARKSLPLSSYIRVDEQRMNAFEAGYVIGHRDAAREALRELASLRERLGER